MAVPSTIKSYQNTTVTSFELLADQVRTWLHATSTRTFGHIIRFAAETANRKTGSYQRHLAQYDLPKTLEDGSKDILRVNLTIDYKETSFTKDEVKEAVNTFLTALLTGDQATPTNQRTEVLASAILDAWIRGAF